MLTWTRETHYACGSSRHGDLFVIPGGGCTRTLLYKAKGKQGIRVFEDVANTNDAFEVCRIFLATLQLVRTPFGPDWTFFFCMLGQKPPIIPFCFGLLRDADKPQRICSVVITHVAQHVDRPTTETLKLSRTAKKATFVCAR